MKTFKEGDRVSHPTHGEGTVVSPYSGTGWSTVKFDTSDGEKNMMTDDNLLTPVSDNPTARFKTGDRVHHAQYGDATVIGVEYEVNLITIQPDVHRRPVHVHPISLTHEPKAVPKFKTGDRVSHPLHRDGTVEEYDEYSGLYTVGLGGYRCYRALEHQIKLAVPAPKFNVQVLYTDSDGINSGVMSRQRTESYLTNLPHWDTVESITITRAKG